jgi:hypothetical protein
MSDGIGVARMGENGSVGMFCDGNVEDRCAVHLTLLLGLA